MNFLDDASFKQGLIRLQQEMITKEDEAYEYWADKMVKLVKAYIKSGKVTVKSGIAVNTSGGSGATSAEGEGTIS